MLARIGGHTLGVAKNINPVIVRVPTTLIKPAGATWADGLSQILKDVEGKGKKGVLSMSIHFPRMRQKLFGGSEFTIKNSDGSDGYDYYRGLFAGMLRKLADNGLALVTGSGNGGLVSGAVYCVLISIIMVLC